MKKLIYLLSLVMIITMASCTTDNVEKTTNNTIVPKTLYVECSKIADTIRLDIMNSSNQIIETQLVTHAVNRVFSVNKGSKFKLRFRVANQTFAGSYVLQEDYGNIIVLQDSFTSWYNSFTATKEY
jgi:hypothetical protein